MSKILPDIPKGDLVALRRVLQKLSSVKLGSGASPTFSGLTLTGLTASRLLATDANNLLVSTDAYSWVTQTANQVLIADDGDGTITFSTPQDIHTGASPQFAGLTVTNACVLGSDSAVFQPNADSTTFFQIKDQDANDLVVVDTTNNALLLPGINLIGTIYGSYNTINGDAFASDTGFTYCHATGDNIVQDATGAISRNNLVGLNLCNKVTFHVYDNNIVGAWIANVAAMEQVIRNNLVGAQIARDASNVWYNNAVGYILADNATGTVGSNNLVGDNIASTSTAAVQFNNMVGSYLVNAATGSINYNNIIGWGIGEKATGEIGNNNIIGTAIAGEITGNLYSNNLIGTNLAESATGTMSQNYIVGTDLVNDITGDVKYNFIGGYQCVYDTTNETDLERVIAFPYESLKESSATDLDDSIALGYRAGYQNAYNSPALFGREAVANANNQVVIGSTFYTGGVRINAALDVAVEYNIVCNNNEVVCHNDKVVLHI